MSKVSIGFSSPKKFKIGAEIIKLWMGTSYSHVYLKVYSAYTKQFLIYQASHGTVHLLTAASFEQNNVVVAEFDMSVQEPLLRNCLAVAQQLLGRPYGYLGLLKLGLHKLINWPKVGDGDSSFHCSELIARLFPELCENLAQDFVEPVDLYSSLTKRQSVI